ncbi:MAG: FG-GAP repeat domain-containing protein, partial [Pirellulaceae bacterium]
MPCCRAPVPSRAARSERSARNYAALLVVLSWLSGVSVPAAAQTWVEDSFDDFADGRLDGAGQNLYVHRDGSVRTIHRFDLNQDGYLDLIFNSTHDNYSAIPSTVVACATDRRLSTTTMGVDGSQRAVLADFNRDGYLDAAFCPNRGGVQNGRRFISICWGGEDGWPASRCNGALPTNQATRIAAVDLNADGWQDLAVLNGSAWLAGQPAGAIVQIFWNHEGSFLLSRRLELGVPAAVDLAGGDLDRDGAADLAVLTPDGVETFWSSRPADTAEFPADASLLPRSRIPVPGRNALCLVMHDVTGDERMDLITGHATSDLHIAAGPPTQPRASDSWKMRVVSAAPASHLAAGDLDGDGRADLALTYFSTARAAGGEAAGADRTATGEVVILWGTAGGFP